MEDQLTQKKNNLFVILCGIFITNALVAELIGVKIFSLERSLGFQPIGTRIFPNFNIEFLLTAGVIIWPVVFITTDIINEYFGKKGVRKITLISVALIAYSFITIFLVTKLKPAQFWLEVNSKDKDGHPFNINYAFNTVYLQSARIIVASLTAFLISQLLDVFIFQKLRAVTGKKWIWLRATGSTLISQLIDSFVVLFVAFYILGSWSFNNVLQVATNNYIYKFFVAILVTPLIYLGHYFIDKYLGTEAAEKIADEASEDKSFF